MPALDLQVVRADALRQHRVRLARRSGRHVGLHLGHLLGGHLGHLLPFLGVSGRHEQQRGEGDDRCYEFAGHVYLLRSWLGFRFRSDPPRRTRPRSRRPSASCVDSVACGACEPVGGSSPGRNLAPQHPAIQVGRPQPDVAAPAAPHPTAAVSTFRAPAGSSGGLRGRWSRRRGTSPRSCRCVRSSPFPWPGRAPRASPVAGGSRLP